MASSENKIPSSPRNLFRRTCLKDDLCGPTAQQVRSSVILNLDRVWIKKVLIRLDPDGVEVREQAPEKSSFSSLKMEAHSCNYLIFCNAKHFDCRKYSVLRFTVCSKLQKFRKE